MSERPTNTGAATLGRVIGVGGDLALMAWAATETDGALRIALIAWVAFTIVCILATASSAKAVDA